MNKIKKPVFVPTLPSNVPSGYMATPELDRANDLGRMAFDLEQALLDRNNTLDAIKAVVPGFTPWQSGRGATLMEQIARIERIKDEGPTNSMLGVRVLEGMAERFAADFRAEQRGYLGVFAPRHPSLLQIQAAELAERNKAAQANNSRTVRR
jgi:hypothetical protein